MMTTVSSGISLWLAMAHGSAKGGGSLTVCDLGRGETRKETPDYEALAKLFNRPDVPKKPRKLEKRRLSDLRTTS